MSTWTKEQIESSFDRICEHIAEGNPLNSALELHDTPVKNTFYNWIDYTRLNNPNEEDIQDCKRRMNQYARAKEERARVIFEEILEIADDGSRDTKLNKDGVEVVDNEIVQRSRLRIDARKWMLGKMQPKKYGDKIDVTTGGEKIKQSKDYSKLSDEEIVQLSILNKKATSNE